MDPYDIQSICPKLQKFVIELGDSRPGITFDRIRLRNLKSGRNSTVLGRCAPKNDRFSLIIPYCDATLQWDVLFLCGHPEFPPDFHFHGHDFLDNPDCHFLAKNVPSLAKWDYNDPKALLNVITEFLMLYKMSQLQMIPNELRLAAELSMLLESESPENVEILKQPDSVSILVCLSSQIPRLANDNFKIVLFLTMQLRFDSRPQQSIKSYGEHEFWDADDYSKLPSFSSSGNSLLMDYIADLKEEINKIVTSKLATIAKRKKLIFQFIATFKSALVEFDAVSFSFVVFSLSKENFSFFLRVDVPKNYPHEAPQYKLISNYCVKNLSNFDRVVYNINAKSHPTLPPVDVVRNCVTRLMDVFHNFKRDSIELLERNLNSLKM